MDNCIRQAHIANPAQKTSLPLVRHLSFMQRPNATEFFGLCKASFESPSMSKPMSKPMSAMSKPMSAMSKGVGVGAFVRGVQNKDEISTSGTEN